MIGHMPKGLKQRGGVYVPEYLPLGTTISRHWDDDYIEVVTAEEAKKGYPICGAKRSEPHPIIEGMPAPCLNAAGFKTDHPGEGRCYFHIGGEKTNLKDGRSSTLRHRRLDLKMREFLEQQELTDIRQAIALSWAAIDELMGDDETVTPDRAQELVQAASRIGTLIKQHHDVTEGQKLVIEVPQFMQWAEFLYTLAIRHIQEAGGNPGAFLSEAETYYNYAIGSAIGDSARAIGPGDNLEA